MDKTVKLPTVLVYDYETNKELGEWAISVPAVGEFILREKIDSGVRPSENWQDNMYLCKTVTRTEGDLDIIHVEKYDSKSVENRLKRAEEMMERLRKHVEEK